MYRVIWLDATLNRLAELYVDCDLIDQHRIATGVDGLNHRLADDPRAVGESRDGSLRIAFPPLLSVRFRVDEQSRTVRVIGVSRYGH